VIEGTTIKVPYLGSDEPTFRMQAAGPAIQPIDDIAHDLVDDDDLRWVAQVRSVDCVSADS
jgi:hypothetical protein